ncbi:hypothetical protein WAF17_18625 [Bernardetia sp. ABR2-2B]|uniref:hypothetical protein n=1 Tax=Bernardetia sp. ABR2-2B TaxID=3127472 RepID=UPI0030CBD4EC
MEQLDSTLQKELRQKGIIRITSIRTDGKCKYIQYMTNWAKHPVGDFFLNYDVCPIEKTKKGYYKQDSFIEIWGVGNGWTILVDSDWI